MGLFKGVPPDPYRGLPPELHPWVDRCKRYHLEWLLCGASNQINFKRIALDLESSVRPAKDKALKDFKRFTKHLEDRVLASYLVDDLKVELQRRGITLDTANAVLEAIEAALTSTPSTRVGEGRPAKAETRVVLFLWSKLKADGLSDESTASRVIAVVLNKKGTLQAALFYIPADDRDTWLRMGMAVKSKLGDGGFELWDEWSRTADNYDPKAARNTWRSITPDGGVTIGTLYHEAQQRGFRFNGETAIKRFSKSIYQTIRNA